MRLLLDSDAFCKLVIGGIFEDAIRVLGVSTSDCGRLAALPHMLRRGKIRSSYGPTACDVVIPLTAAIPVISPPSPEWLDKLTLVDDVDPGEALIFAAAAESGLMLVTGDKRSLRALKSVAGFAEALDGRIVVMEAILIALSRDIEIDELRRKMQLLAAHDVMIQVCFSLGNNSPIDALKSYFQDLAAEVQPLVLWDPRMPGGIE